MASSRNFSFSAIAIVLVATDPNGLTGRKMPRRLFQLWKACIYLTGRPTVCSLSSAIYIMNFDMLSGENRPLWNPAVIQKGIWNIIREGVYKTGSGQFFALETCLLLNEKEHYIISMFIFNIFPTFYWNWLICFFCHIRLVGKRHIFVNIFPSF